MFGCALPTDSISLHSRTRNIFYYIDTDKLHCDRPPPHEAFYSSLKNANITDEENAFCQRVWNEKKMTTFRDFLVWYNNLDVEPFVQAVKNLQKYYFERNIDKFKCSISVPGLARRMLFGSGTKEVASLRMKMYMTPSSKTSFGFGHNFQTQPRHRKYESICRYM